MTPFIPPAAPQPDAACQKILAHVAQGLTRTEAERLVANVTRARLALQHLIEQEQITAHISYDHKSHTLTTYYPAEPEPEATDLDLDALAQTLRHTSGTLGHYTRRLSLSPTATHRALHALTQQHRARHARVGAAHIYQVYG